MDAAPHVVHEIELASGVLAEADDPQCRIGDLPVREDPVAVIPQRPDLAGVVVAVDVGAGQVLQARPPVDVPAGQRPGLGVAVLDDRRQDGRRPRLPPGLERVIALPEIPTVVPSATDQVHHLPKVLPDVAGPEVARGPVEAEFPRLPQAVSPDLGPGPRDAHERVVTRDGIGFIRRGVVTTSIRRIELDSSASPWPLSSPPPSPAAT